MTSSRKVKERSAKSRKGSVILTLLAVISACLVAMYRERLGSYLESVARVPEEVSKPATRAKVRGSRPRILNETFATTDGRHHDDGQDQTNSSDIHMPPERYDDQTNSPNIISRDKITTNMTGYHHNQTDSPEVSREIQPEAESITSQNNISMNVSIQGDNSSLSSMNQDVISPNGSLYTFLLQQHNATHQTKLPMQMIESKQGVALYSVESRRRAQSLGLYTGPFDLVYLWANNTREWTEAKENVTRRIEARENATNTTKKNPKWSPTRDNDELRLSIRCVEKYLPWVRNIYILSSFGQVPYWLDADHPRVRLVDSDELIRSVNGTAPNFNSHSLYLASAYIPDLSEIYLQMDDDFIIGQPLPETMFFANYKHEVTSVVKWPYRKDLRAQGKLLNMILPGYATRDGRLKWATHMPRCWNKTRVKELWRLHSKEVIRTLNSQIRSGTDIDLTSFYGPYARAYYDNPLFEFNRTSGTVHSGPNGDETVHFKHGEGRRTHYYGTIGGFLNGRRNDTNRPMLVCLQDKGDDVREGAFVRLSRVFRVGPSSFERERSVPNKEKAEVYGHRGVGFPRPDEGPLMENSMESIEAAQKEGVTFVEIDVGVTLDGTVIVGHFHKELYEDCPADVRGEGMVVSEMTYEDLCSRSRERGLPVPARLVDVLARFRGRLGFQIELKQDTDYKLARACNKAAARDLREERCEARSNEDDTLIRELIAVLEQANFPLNQVIISSFEAARLNNFRRMNSRYHMLKLVGGQNEGVDGLIKICQLYLGQRPHVAVPNGFATKGRVAELRGAGIKVEIGLPGVGHCLSMRDSSEKLPDVQAARRQIADALAKEPNSICTDFPREVLDQQRQ